jgi:hypothetical protein
VHENGRYVKLKETVPAERSIVPTVRRIALAAAVASALLGAAAPAHAESVPASAGATDATLAVAPDGSPRVAFVGAAGSVVVAARAADGTWAEQALPALPGPRAFVVGLAVAPSGRTVVLAEDPAAHWLALAEQNGASWSVRTVATAPKGGLLGFGGLALDHAGSPLIAYVYQLPSRKSWLRLVHEDAAGCLVGERVTRSGFPSSDVLPAAAPVVMPGGAVRVVEAYDSATIEWARTKNKKDWIGQFVYGTAIGAPAGVVKAAAGASGVWSAWTELFPSFDESQLVLALHRNGESTTILSHHAFLVSLVLPASGPEIAGDDYVDLAGARTVYAGLVADTAGTTVELDGDLKGYAVDPAGGRQYLLVQPDGLDWYRAAAPPTTHFALSVTVQGASFVLGGTVYAQSGTPVAGTVQLWRETAAGAQLFASLPLAADGTFTATDLPPVRPLLYRAVYVDPASGVPLASLFRTVLGD